MSSGQFVFLGHEAQPCEGELPEKAHAPAMSTLQALLENLHGGLEAILAQNRQDLFEGELPGRLGIGDFGFARRAGRLQMRHDVGTDPGAGGRISKRGTVVKAQFDDAGQALNQKREVDFHFAHCQLGVEPLQALPDHSLAVEPERRLRQARLQFHQQVCIFALIVSFLVGLELVDGQAAQHGDLLRVALGDGVDGQPQQRAIEAQGAQVSGFLLEPPGAQWARVFLLSAQCLVSFFFVVDRCAGGEQLRGGLLDLSHRCADHSGLRQVVGSAQNHAFQTAGKRQQQGRIVAQMLGTRRVQAFQMFHQTAEQRQLLFYRDVFGQHLLQTRHQPTNRGGAGSGFGWMKLGPMVFAKVVQQSKTGEQALEGFTLIQRPGQPGANPQILGLGAQQFFAVFTDFQPVNLTALVHRRGFAQLAFQRFVFARKANILARKILLRNRGFSEFKVMRGKFA